MEAGTRLRLEVSGQGTGVMEISDAPDFRNLAAAVPVFAENTAEYPLELKAGKRALYFRYCGTGSVNFIAFELC